jgi:hypothetical protein
VAESGTGSSIGFGNTKYPYYYGPEGRLVLDERPNNGQLIVVKEQKKNKEVNN